MSTSRVNEIPQHIQQALNEFAKRLLPAKLDTSSVVNGPLLSKWLREAGYVINSMTSPELANALYEVTVAHVRERKLEWLKEPKVLRQHDIVIVERPDSNTFTEERNKQAQAIEARNKQKTDDAKAEQDLTSLIEGLSVTIDGRMQYGWNSQGQADLREYAARLRKTMPLSDVVKKVRAARDLIYKAAEYAGTDMKLSRRYVRPF